MMSESGINEKYFPLWPSTSFLIRKWRYVKDFPAFLLFRATFFLFDQSQNGERGFCLRMNLPISSGKCAQNHCEE